MISAIRPGDYVFIQMGHNHQKEKGEGVGVFSTCKAALEQFIGEARERGALLDLHAMSKFFYAALGPEASQRAFAGEDPAQHDNYGSYEWAQCIVEGIGQNGLGIVRCRVKDVPPFRPGAPRSAGQLGGAAGPGEYGYPALREPGGGPGKASSGRCKLCYSEAETADESERE